MSSNVKIFLTTAIILVIFTVISCDSKSHNEAVVARVGNYTLLRSEVERLVPSGTSYNDSIAMIQRYINSWALKYLLIAKAEEEIPNIKSAIDKEVEDYKNSLLAYRYEKLYIDQRLDTVVTEEEGRRYYNNNQSDMTLKNSAVKARIIKISSSSPNLARIKSMYKSEGMEDVAELEQICYNSADRYVNFNNQWVDISAAVRELPINISDAEKQLSQNNYIEVKDSLYNYFALFPEIAHPNSIAPYEFYQQRIKETIIGKRKQELIADLEKDLITEALNNNTIITTVNK